jgi:C_GCAxxG_C_C family probable redox protein
MNQADVAVELFRSDCACSQAILGNYGPLYGLDENQAMRLAAGFAGGMRMGEACGAVTGAFMVLGLAYGTNECRTKEGRRSTYAAVDDFAERFLRRNQSLLCRELLGCDINTDEGLAFAQAHDLFAKRCVRLVRDAAEILEVVLPDSGDPERSDR